MLDPNFCNKLSEINSWHFYGTANAISLEIFFRYCGLCVDYVILPLAKTAKTQTTHNPQNIKNISELIAFDLP